MTESEKTSKCHEEQDLHERMDLLLKGMEVTVEEIKKKELLNEQYVLDWLDMINKLSVRY